MAKAPPPSNRDLEVSFARELGLFDAPTIGVGAMISAGIFVSTGIAAGEAGPASILASALNGFVTLQTALNYAELASAYPETVGGYSLIRKAFPAPVGFASGWMLWFSYIIACRLFALGFDSHFWEFIASTIPSLHQNTLEVTGEHPGLPLVTVTVSIAFVAINMRGTALSQTCHPRCLYHLLWDQRVVSKSVRCRVTSCVVLPQKIKRMVPAMGLIFVAFEGSDLIATVEEDIKEPERTIPLATMTAMALTVTIYLLILLVCIGAIQPETLTSGEFLGAHQDTAIVKAAANFMPLLGVDLIVFGGLLSTLSALNAAILASSRVAYPMSRDQMLPAPISNIDPVRHPTSRYW